MVVATTNTTTTLSKVQVPNVPSSISISKLSDTALRLTWLDNSTGVSQLTVLANSLACDATRVSSAANLVQIVVDAGKANAGKMLKFEVFKAGKWSLLGSARVTSAGATAISAKTSLVGEKGKLPIRATQGSRFVCEGNLN